MCAIGPERKTKISMTHKKWKGNIRCPDCYSQCTIVIDSRMVECDWFGGPESLIVRRRRRKCKKCTARFTTYEMHAGEIMHLAKVAEQIEKLRELVAPFPVLDSPAGRFTQNSPHLSGLPAGHNNCSSDEKVEANKL